MQPPKAFIQGAVLCNSTLGFVFHTGWRWLFAIILAGAGSVLPGRAAPQIQPAGTKLVSESGVPANGAIDPYETVTVNWALTNAGNTATANLTATLLETNGVYYPTAAQNYGVIPAGGTVTRPFTFIPSGVCGGSVTGMLQLVDGAVSMGSVSQFFPLGSVGSSGVITQVFANTSPITIVDNDLANPYPSTIAVSLNKPVIKVTATLNGFLHGFPNDVDVLLAGPAGGGVMLMAGCGAGFSVNNLVLTFDDDAVKSVPTESRILSGAYKPTANAADSFLPPAPPEPYATDLASLANTPNGDWSLYVMDLFVTDNGSISGGWSLSFVTSNAVAACVTTFPAPRVTSSAVSNNVLRFNWSTIPGPHYQVQFRTNLSLGSWQDLGGPILATNKSLGIADVTTNGPSRFYRVVVGP